MENKNDLVAQAWFSDISARDRFHPKHLDYITSAVCFLLILLMLLIFEGQNKESTFRLVLVSSGCGRGGTTWKTADQVE